MSEESLSRPSTSPSNANTDDTIPIERTLHFDSGQRVLGRYVLESVLGQGGMAVVWRARDENLGETVALKFLPEVVARDGVAVEELKEETRRARRLTHPNIVRIHDFVQDAAMAAVSMEYVDGDTLANLRLAQPGKIFSVATLAPLVAQLCAALEYAHTNAKLVHRDIKPANLLVTRDGQLKIADFGIARGLTEASVRLTNKTAGRTSGTILYASPQQLMGEKPTEADDIYALGATLYELLTGKPPFFRGDAHSLIMQVRDRVPAPMAERRAELEVTGTAIPAAWETTILACLAKRAEERPKSAREVVNKLELGAGRPGGGSIAGKHAAVRGEPSSKGGLEPRSKALLLAGAALAAVVGALGWFWWSAKPAAAEKVLSSAAAATAKEFVVTVDPPEAEARVSVGTNANVPVKNGKAVFTNLTDGEHELAVKADGYRNFEARVSVAGGRGAEDAKLIAVRGALELKARPGTIVTVLDTRGRETRGIVDPTGHLVIENLPAAGRYKLRLEHPECEPVEHADVAISGEARTQLTVQQMVLPGELRVFSVPEAAEVHINGQAVGKTPATLKNQPSGKKLQVEITAKGYRKTERSLTLRPGEVKTLNVGTLVATSSGIEFRNLPTGFSMESSRVLVDSREVRPKRDGKGWRVDDLESGARVVEILNPDFEPWKLSVTVEDRVLAQVDARLKPKPATLSLTVGGAPSYELVANGRKVPVKEGLATLPPNEALVLVVSAKGFKNSTRTLTMPPNGRESWNLMLEKFHGPEIGQQWTIPNLNLELMPVGAGAFLMGSPEGAVGRNSDEGPQTRVTMTQPYWLGKTEVTQREWSAVMEGNPSRFKGADRPVENISWTEANAFCRKLTERERGAGRLPEGFVYRLPTEAQWEYACRAGTTGDYAGELDAMAWYDKNSADQTHAVALRPANAWKLHDMHGNVWEWVYDLYVGKYPGGTVTDQMVTASSGSYRVLRGGGWEAGARSCRSSIRGGTTTRARRDGTVGFRLALAPAIVSASVNERAPKNAPLKAGGKRSTGKKKSSSRSGIRDPEQGTNAAATSAATAGVPATPSTAGEKSVDSRALPQRSGTEIFDRSMLDQPPEPHYQAPPQYPFDLWRAGIPGEVLIDFIVDTK